MTVIVEERLTNEIHEINIEPTWKTKTYNFFEGPPADYSFSPDEAISSFIRAIRNEKDLSIAEGFIHPETNDFPWEKLEHEKWAKGHDRRFIYKGSYLGFDDVFYAKLRFGKTEEDNSEDLLEQKIYLVENNGKWKIIHVNSNFNKSVSTIHKDYIIFSNKIVQ
ncbi:hypothetical protein GGQ84_002827 [Desulfitispora alkaliphila]|uniref:hypothetical protein n=1 Tax=Desulfitispora alkaliphila TaxID=622674 RepID=UPI003D1E4862